MCVCVGGGGGGGGAYRETCIIANSWSGTITHFKSFIQIGAPSLPTRLCNLQSRLGQIYSY